jgi:hypothetical protein
MSSAITIYSREYAYKGHAFQVWSYLDNPDPNRSTLRFAFQAEGETVESLPDRAEAVRQARQRIDELPAKPVEETPAADPPQAIQAQQAKQQEIARPAQLSLL